ncbi:hypothetical protein N7519_008210 [Penicillium mononematosum]|uniref:uncharacterized protein n=1 Tax=Penicillium mononematosum TaxID=268346 RepID=UPI00254897A2|nr:uncharacterized protein N7519_008210 [Penicillium mononematosum]KAJ6177749.1 hypothetical protein N7519_008210 [Penicillium mononematosum]
MSEKNAPLGASNATKSRSTDAGKDTSVKNPQTSAVKAETTGSGSHSSPKKRRKVNHACVYCRRSHMTCDSVRHLSPLSPFTTRHI